MTLAATGDDEEYSFAVFNLLHHKDTLLVPLGQLTRAAGSVRLQISKWQKSIKLRA